MADGRGREGTFEDGGLDSTSPSGMSLARVGDSPVVVTTRLPYRSAVSRALVSRIAASYEPETLGVRDPNARPFERPFHYSLAFLIRRVNMYSTNIGVLYGSAYIDRGVDSRRVDEFSGEIDRLCGILDEVHENLNYVYEAMQDLHGGFAPPSPSSTSPQEGENRRTSVRRQEE